MPGNWTPEQKEAQSKKLKEYWKRRREEEARSAQLGQAMVDAMKNKKQQLEKPKGFFGAMKELVTGRSA